MNTSLESGSFPGMWPSSEMNTSVNTEFEALVEEYYRPLYRFAAILSGKPDLARELTRNAFCEILAGESAECDSTRIKVGLFQSVYRNFLQKGSNGSASGIFDPDSAAQAICPFAHSEERNEFAASAIPWLREMEGELRMPLLLFYLEKFSRREIAEVLALSGATVLSRIYRGKILLKQKLNSREAIFPQAAAVPGASERRSAHSA